MKVNIDELALYFKARIAKLTAQFQDEGAVIFEAPDRRGIGDGGGYGDIYRDERPDFLKEVNDGWKPLFPDERTR